MKGSIIIALAALICTSLDAQKLSEHSIRIPEAGKEVREGHLQMGGTSPAGGSIAFNSYYMSVDGKPVVPVMGEFHYSRYPARQWEEEILKMKAGGVTVIPTYVFWAIHEEKEGIFDWSGDRDLRRFVLLCKKHGMSVIVRIGPFCHGEIRNGALPDWLFAKAVDVRSNDPEYLSCVGRFYAETARQLEGLYYKDGGPVIACQIENEHQHSAAPWAINYPGEPADYTSSAQDTSPELGEIHMKTLKDMAVAKGIITPFYTATGWGNAAVIGYEAIPVTSAYTYPFWTEPAMSDFCLFKDIHSHPDYEPVRYKPDDFPSFCAEMGVGIQMIYSRRPVVPGKAAEALMVRTLGSGSNGIGYYMYHGGSTPKMLGGRAFFSDEAMGMPKISYDFQAPLGEFGLEGTMYRNLRILHSFLSDFGEVLAPMGTVLPDGYRSITPGNRDDLRWAVRSDGRSGFVFMVNFQDHDGGRHNMEGLRLTIQLPDETVCIPEKGGFTLAKDESVILPFNLDMEGNLLKYATAQLLMKIEDGGTAHYFFFAPEGMQAEYLFAGKKLIKVAAPGLSSTFRVKTRGGKAIKVTTLTREQAMDAVKLDGKLLVTKAQVLAEKSGPVLLSLGSNEVEYVLYPSKAGLSVQKASVPAVEPGYECKGAGMRRMTVRFSEAVPEQVEEYFLKVDYTGDVAMAFLGGELVNDHFWHGKPWLIGLDRHRAKMADESLYLYIRPLHDDAPFLHDIPQEAIPVFGPGRQACSFNDIRVIPQYRIPLQ